MFNSLLTQRLVTVVCVRTSHAITCFRGSDLRVACSSFVFNPMAFKPAASGLWTASSSWSWTAGPANIGGHEYRGTQSSFRLFG